MRLSSFLIASLILCTLPFSVAQRRRKHESPISEVSGSMTTVLCIKLKIQHLKCYKGINMYWCCISPFFSIVLCKYNNYIDDFFYNHESDLEKDYNISHNNIGYNVQVIGVVSNEKTTPAPVSPPLVAAPSKVVAPQIAAVPASRPSLTLSSKKGVGWNYKVGRLVSLLNSFNASWYYTWGPTTEPGSIATHIPMSYSARTIPFLTKYSPIVLGFNEPDHPYQSNMTVGFAVEMWPALMLKAGMLGSPAMAGDPYNSGSWLEQFMKKMGNKTDFVTMHWYRGTNVTRFKSDVQSICNKFKKPVWITEFAPQTTGNALANPMKYSHEKVISFMINVTSWMNNNPCVSGYAWHDSKYGTSALYIGFNGTNSTLSETGRAYAAIH